MVTLKLKRLLAVGREVVGVLHHPDGSKYPTIESKPDLFNDGIYEIKKQYSPKFKRRLWEFQNIPGRSEIKFHPGSNVRHSKGCPLIRSIDLDRLHASLDSNKTYLVEVQTIKVGKQIEIKYK